MMQNVWHTHSNSPSTPATPLCIKCENVCGCTTDWGNQLLNEEISEYMRFFYQFDLKVEEIGNWLKCALHHHS